jgi:tetratricopeptide (TPR) repeat protein
MTIEQVLLNAVEAHKAGKLQDAEALYRAILQAQANHPDANHNLGVMAVSLNRTEAALPLFKIALEANPNQGQFWLSYVDALMKEKQFENAKGVLEEGKKRGLAGEMVDALEAQLVQLDVNSKSQKAEANKLFKAIELREMGRYQEAQDWLTKYLEAESSDAEGWSLLSQVLLLDNKDAQAENALFNATSVNANLPSIYRNQARLFLKNSKPAEALLKAQSGYEQSTDDPESWIVLAASLGANQRDVEALPLIERALKARPNYAEAFANRAMIRLRAKNITGAIEDSEMAVSFKPHLTQLWGLLGSLHYQNKNLSGAIEAVKKAQSLEPDNVNYIINLGEFLRQDQRMEEAIAILKKATEDASENASAWINLGTALQQDNKIEKAKVAYKKALAINPNSAEIYSNLGALAKDTEDWKTALTYLEQAIAIRPDLAEAHSNLGIVLQELGRLEDALASHTNALMLKPDYAQAHSNMGNILKELGRLQDAEASYNKAIAIKPDLAEAHSNLGITLKELGRLQEAEESYKKAITNNPSLAETHYNLGNTLIELGRFEDAEESYKKAIAINPDLAEAHSNLGTTLKELGRLQEAEESYKKAIAIKPDFAEVHYNLSIALKEFGRVEEAEASCAQAMRLKPDYIKAHNEMLTCLYLMDKKELLFDELNYLITQDKPNSVVGSITCRSALRYGEEKPNIFCNEPLKYALLVDLKSRYNFEEIFVQHVKSILNESKRSNKRQPLLSNGYQTSGNLFDLESNLTDQIQKTIRLEIERYRTNFESSEEGFIRKWPKEYSLYGWLISMKSGGELSPHIHENGWLSGSVYINVPPKTKIESGNLVVALGKDIDVVDERQNSKEVIDVVTGSMALFPASLMHHTIPFESDEDRIVLAFDVVPKSH